MGVSKLSQIAESGSPPSTTAFLVGVDQSGPTDYLYQINLVSRIILIGDLALYVDPVAGSDSYNGLSPTYVSGITGPTATVQQAVNLAANDYDFVNLYSLTINVATPSALLDTDFIFLPTLLGMSFADYPGEDISPQYALIQGDTNTPTNVTYSCCFNYAVSAQWVIQGFSSTGDYAAIATQQGCLASINLLDFSGSYSGSNGAFACDGGSIDGFAGTFTISSNMPCFIEADLGTIGGTTINFNEAGITFNNSPVFSRAFLDLQGSNFQFREASFTNANTVTGVKAILAYSTIDLIEATADGATLTRANFPGDQPMQFPNGISTVTVTPVINTFTTSLGCLFSDLYSAEFEQLGVVQFITDCTTGTPGRSASGGGTIPAMVWNPDNTTWKVISSNAVPSSPVSGFLARATGLSTTQQAAYVALIEGLISDGLWDLLDVLYIFATSNTATAALNLKSPDFTATVHGNLTFTAGTGWQGDGSTGFLDTGFAPNAAGNNFLQNWASAGNYILTSRTSQANYDEMGEDQNNYDLWTSALTTAGSGGLLYAICAAGLANLGISNTNAQGSYLYSRTDANSTFAFKNGSSIHTNGSDTSASLSASHIYIFAKNDGGGSQSGYSADQLAAAWFGGGMSPTQAGQTQGWINGFMTAIGKNVYS